MGVVGFAAGLGLVAAGALLYAFSGKLPPNPFVGVRIGYAYVSRKAWVKLVKVSSILVAALGAVSAALSLTVGDLPGLMSVGLGSVIITYFLIYYAERVGEEESLRTPAKQWEVLKEVPKIPPPAAALLIVIGTAVVSMLYVMVNYPKLPEQVPSHFGPDWKPNAYSPKSVAVGVTFTNELIILAVTALLYYLGWRKPEALYKPWFDISTYVKVVNTLYIVLALVNMLVGIGSTTMIVYALNNGMPSWLIISFDVVLVALLLSVVYLIAVTVKAYRRVRVSYPSP
ncbi:MAG: DUF1648 domain-containing protein [Desulfurococcales archaeon]|nr:DUF1648 domain-containing protein [Desulfurococcales archaeon]